LRGRPRARTARSSDRAIRARLFSRPNLFLLWAAWNIRTHWGPITRHEAELRRECDALFLKVQQIVDATPGAGADLV
jgi:hypothetical protein